MSHPVAAVAMSGASARCHEYPGIQLVILFHPAWRADLVGGIQPWNGVSILSHALTIFLFSFL